MEGNIGGPYIVLFRDGIDQKWLGEFDEIAMCEDAIKEEVPSDADGVRIVRVVKRFERGWIERTA